MACAKNDKPEISKLWCNCFTCGKRLFYDEAQAGHFKSRYWESTRYYEENCHPQCNHCNVDLGGNLDIYRIQLIEKYGLEYVEYLEFYSRQVVKRNSSDYKDLLKELKNKLKIFDNMLYKL